MKTNSKKFSIRFAKGKTANLAASLREDIQKLLELGEIDARREIVGLNDEIGKLQGRVSELEKELKVVRGRLALADGACDIKDELLETLRQNNTKLRAEIQQLELKLQRVGQAIGS